MFASTVLQSAVPPRYTDPGGTQDFISGRPGPSALRWSTFGCGVGQREVARCHNAQLERDGGVDGEAELPSGAPLEPESEQ